MTRKQWTRRAAAWLALITAAGCSSDASHANYSSVGTGGQVLDGGTLLEGRADHAVAPLGSSQLLVVGGATTREGASDTLERYDPSTGWSEPLAARLSTPRVGHLAIALPDGRVWIVGGADARGHDLDSSELFDPRSATLIAGPRLQHARAYGAAAVTSGTVLLAGGTSASVEAWDANTLQPQGDQALPGAPQLRPSLAPYRGGWLLAGGRDATGEALAPVWLDPAAGLAEVATEQLVRRAPAVTPAGGGQTFLVAGRLDQRPSVAFQRAERGAPTPVFDDGFRVLEPRDWPSVCATRDGVLVVGGQAVLGPPTPLTGVEWVTAAGSSAVDPLAIGRRDPQLTPLADGRVVISGGVAANGRPVALIEVFVPGAASGAADRYSEATRRAALAAQRRRDLQRAQAEIARLRAELARTQQQLAQAQADVAARDAQLVALNAQVAQLTQQLTQAQQLASQSAAQNAALQMQVADLAFRLRQAQRNRDQAVRERDQARAAVVLLQQEVKQAQAQIQALRARAPAASGSRPQVVRALPK